jgi:hypothetical protein
VTEEPWVNPASIPQLVEILRRGLLREVRIFECWCEKGDRLCQVVRVQGRLLAVSLARTGAPNPELRRDTHAVHRSYLQAAWLDLDAYYVPHDSPGPAPYLLSTQCQHERLLVPLIWLREHVEARTSKRVITAAVRFGIETRQRSG